MKIYFKKSLSEYNTMHHFEDEKYYGRMKNRDQKKYFPHRESNPGRLREREESLPLDHMGLFKYLNIKENQDNNNVNNNKLLQN